MEIRRFTDMLLIFSDSFGDLKSQLTHVLQGRKVLHLLAALNYLFKFLMFESALSIMYR
jgi:hypothetical protein